MSDQAARDLMERMRTDEAFREKVAAAQDADARLAFVNAQGFDCSAEEIEGLAKQLSPEELDGVAAGLFFLGDYFLKKPDTIA